MAEDNLTSADLLAYTMKSTHTFCWCNPLVSNRKYTASSHSHTRKLQHHHPTEMSCYCCWTTQPFSLCSHERTGVGRCHRVSMTRSPKSEECVEIWLWCLEYRYSKEMHRWLRLPRVSLEKKKFIIRDFTQNQKLSVTWGSLGYLDLII